MKHNKKRNTAFLYECLIRELTKAIIKEDKQKQLKVKGLLVEFFTKGKALSQELDLYRSLMESKELEQNFSKRLMVETKKDFDELDRKEKRYFFSYCVSSVSSFLFNDSNRVLI